VDDMQGPGATGAQQVIRMDGRQFLKPDSALVRTALDLLAAHVADGATGESALCGHCGLYFPCPTVEHARQVVNAGGVLGIAPDPVDRVADSVVESVSESLVELPDIEPQRIPDSAVEADDEVAHRERVGVQ
jgi:hypothetical protein